MTEREKKVNYFWQTRKDYFKQTKTQIQVLNFKNEDFSTQFINEFNKTKFVDLFNVRLNPANKKQVKISAKIKLSETYFK